MKIYTLPTICFVLLGAFAFKENALLKERKCQKKGNSLAGILSVALVKNSGADFCGKAFPLVCTKMHLTKGNQ